MTTNWWSALYDAEIAAALLVRDDDGSVEQTLDFLTDVLALRPGQRVFDQCCGIGSLSNPLAARGMTVLGVDQAHGYIQTAREDAHPNASFETGDCFAFVTPTPVHACFNWWTSYGYGSDAENQSMLQRAFDSLVDGGRFALDTMNVPGVIRHFRADVDLERETPDGTLRVTRRSTLDLAAGRLLKRWTIVAPNGRRTQRDSSVRLTMPHTIVEQLRAVGFEDITLFGGVAREPLTADSLRCIAVARKPGAQSPGGA